MPTTMVDDDVDRTPNGTTVALLPHARPSPHHPRLSPSSVRGRPMMAMTRFLVLGAARRAPSPVAVVVGAISRRILLVGPSVVVVAPPIPNPPRARAALGSFPPSSTGGGVACRRADSLACIQPTPTPGGPPDAAVVAPRSTRRPWGTRGATATARRWPSTVSRVGGRRGASAAADKTIKGPRHVGTTAWPNRPRGGTGSKPTQTTSNRTGTVRRDAPTTSAPWLGGDTGATCLADTRDNSAVLLLRPFLNSAQRAAARPNNHHSDLVGKTGGGDPASTKSKWSIETRGSMRNILRGEVQGHASGSIGAHNQVAARGGARREFPVGVDACARIWAARGSVGCCTAAAATSSVLASDLTPGPLHRLACHVGAPDGCLQPRREQVGRIVMDGGDGREAPHARPVGAGTTAELIVAKGEAVFQRRGRRLGLSASSSPVEGGDALEADLGHQQARRPPATRGSRAGPARCKLGVDTDGPIHLGVALDDHPHAALRGRPSRPSETDGAGLVVGKTRIHLHDC